MHDATIAQRVWLLLHPQADEMEEAAARFNKQVTKLGRDVKAWPVWGWLKETIDAFKKTMPLITDLRNPAMRPRHWQQLMEHINTRSAAHWAPLPYAAGQWSHTVACMPAARDMLLILAGCWHCQIFSN
jgi:hypothetical protein